MKRNSYLLFLLAAAALACGKEEAALPPDKPEAAQALSAATGTVNIGLGSPFLPTRMASPSPGVESTCRRWAFWIFDPSGDSVAYGTGETGESVRRTLLVGDYTVVAVANYPESLVPENVTEKAGLESRVIQLSDNAAGAMVMYGEAPLEMEQDRTVSCSVDVRRLVAKVGVKKVSVAFENPYLAAKTTVLEAIYLTNLYRTSRLGRDYTGAELLSGEALWYNVMGWRAPEDAVPEMDALVGDTAIQATLSPEMPHTTAHYFYACPNATPEGDDTHEASWSKRSTRLVLQVAVGGKTYYYQIQVPAMGRNRVYVADEVILKKLGSMDPEQDIPGALEVVFSAVGDDWDHDVNAAENS